MKIKTVKFLFCIYLSFFSFFTFANDLSKCDVNLFFDKGAYVQAVNSKSGNRVAFDLNSKGVNWTAVENMFDVDSNEMGLKKLNQLKDPHEIVKLWYDTFRYDVIEDYMLHQTTLLKTFDLGSNAKVHIIDANFEGNIIRYSLYATTDIRNVYFYYINALAAENKLLPSPDEMLFVLKSMVNSCQNESLRI